MYQNTNKKRNSSPKKQISEEINAENKDRNIPSLVGNEGMNQILSASDAGNNGGAGNVPNSMANALINAAENVIEKKQKKNKPLFYKDAENDIRNQEFEFE